jgi:predicted ATPase/class 3 adenylate cyclase
MSEVPTALPTGTVTFLFSDVEGSTRLLERLGHEAYADALSAHREVIAAVSADHGGVVVDTEGDGCFLAFPTAPGALEAALTIQAALAGGPVRVRIGLHTGTALLRDSRYVGIDVHRAARIAAAAHGGQIVFSASTRSLLGYEDVAGSAVVRDLGEHRLKDLPAAARLFQLGDEQFPPLRTLSRSNFPAATTSFLGRRQELSEVVELLRRSDVRLVSLVGPGGAGKSRLALEAAAEAEGKFAGGVWWTPLASLHDPARVLSAVAQTLGVGEGQAGTLLDSLVERLAGEQALLVLDNAEHLLPGVAVKLASLAASCPSMTLLVTSRERLRVSIETVWPVPRLAAAEAEQLFVERARSAGQELTASAAVSQLCDRLDGLPLAIELAAARTVVFTPEQLLARLRQQLDLLKGGRDADPRQRTLRAAIDWSYDLLAPEERRVFGGLSVFTGGCTLEAAEEVVGADPDTLQSLIDKSLVRRHATELGPRYSMLATIAEYATEKLETETDVDTIRRRFADWCRSHALELLGIPGPEVPRVATAAEVARFTDDYNNLRSALAWAWDTSADELGVELGAASCRFWLGAGLFHDAASWLRDAERSVPAASPAIRLGALKVAGLIAFFILADSERADVYWTAAQDLARELELEAETAWIDHRLAGVAWERGDLEGAKRLHERTLASHQRDGNRFAEASTLHNLGETLRDLGELDRAELRLLEAEAVYRELGSPELAGNTHSLGDLALDRGDHAAAMTLYRQALLSADGRERRFPAYCLAGIASVLAESGRDDDAALAWGSVCATEQSSGFHMVARERRRYERRLSRLEGTHAWSAGRALSIDAAVDALGLR